MTRDEDFNFRATHWVDLHSLLYNALPPDVFLWGHLLLFFDIVVDDKATVIVQAKVLKSNEIIKIKGHLLVVTDGYLSSIRQKFLPNFKVRFAS